MLDSENQYSGDGNFHLVSYRARMSYGKQTDETCVSNRVSTPFDHVGHVKCLFRISRLPCPVRVHRAFCLLGPKTFRRRSSQDNPSDLNLSRCAFQSCHKLPVRRPLLYRGRSTWKWCILSLLGTFSGKSRCSTRGTISEFSNFFRIFGYFIARTKRQN